MFVKNKNTLSTLSTCDTIVFDKTGTLTDNKNFEIDNFTNLNVVPWFEYDKNRIGKEPDFYLDVDCIRKGITIKLRKWKESELSEFIETCKIVEGSLKRLESDKYTTKLESCNYHIRHIEFEINLKA
jgi:magnesium-transporting ATPase (P-type)